MDLERSTLLVLLSLFTLAAVIAIGLYQRHRAKAAQRKGETSALTDDNRMLHEEATPTKPRESASH